MNDCNARTTGRALVQLCEVLDAGLDQAGRQFIASGVQVAVRRSEER